MLYTITPEGRNQSGDELGILDLVKEGPVEGMAIVQASGYSADIVMKYLDNYVNSGFMVRSRGMLPEATPQQEGPGFTLGGLEKEAGSADAEMGKLISDIM